MQLKKGSHLVPEHFYNIDQIAGKFDEKALIKSNKQSVIFVLKESELRKLIFDNEKKYILLIDLTVSID